MDRVPVTSTVITSAGYDSESGVLQLEFVDGKVYQYFAVPEKTFLELLNPPGGSVGRYFVSKIRNKFPCEPI